MILFFYASLFVVLSSFTPTYAMSLLHVSFHLMFGCPLLLFPGMSTSSILLTMCSSFILLTWPYHFSRFSVIVLDASTTLVVLLMCSFRILSLLVTKHIHLSILISFTSSRASFPLVVAHVSSLSIHRETHDIIFLSKCHVQNISKLPRLPLIIMSIITNGW